jgi:hexosaminidase
MYARLAAVDDNLQFVGIKDRSNRRLMLERAAGSEDIRALQVLVDVLEPVKQYTRTGTDKYTSATPLNRLVDAAHPESDRARRFGLLVNQFVATKPADPATAAELRHELEMWRGNNEKVEPLLQSSSLLAEDVPLSKDLEMVATIGLEALDYHNGGAPAGWRDAQLNMLKEAAAPKAELLDMLVPHVQKLVEAVPTQ